MCTYIKQITGLIKKNHLYPEHTVRKNTQKHGGRKQFRRSGNQN